MRRLITRVPTYRFFFYLPLYIPVIAFLTRFRRKPAGWLILTIIIFMLGTNVNPYLYPYQIAAPTSIFVLISLIGLDVLDQANPWLARLVLVPAPCSFCSPMAVTYMVTSA